MPCTRDCNRNPPSHNIQFCSTLCTPKCSGHCFVLPRPWPIPRPLPTPPPRPLIPPLLPSSVNPPAHHAQGRTLLLLSLIITATLVGAIFMVCLLVKKLREWRNSRRNGPVLFDVHGENLPDDDEERPVFDHHIWYINRVGLQQSVIDSITMFKYRKDEKLIDGSDCSICLGEFQDDESLRLLPKCSHAFHVPCIDTWLRSHKNCPLCRAPVVSNSAAPNLAPIEPVTNPPQPIEDAQMETEAVEEENRGDETSGEGGSNSRENSEIPIKRLSRTLSDLTENQNQEAVEGQEMRRSVSMDLVSAMAIYQATANIQIPEEGSSSNGALVDVKNSVSTSRNVPFTKRGIGNQSLYNLVKSISFGRSVPKAAISMKRFSSGRSKLQWARHYRSQSSILPL